MSNVTKTVSDLLSGLVVVSGWRVNAMLARSKKFLFAQLNIYPLAMNPCVFYLQGNHLDLSKHFSTYCLSWFSVLPWQGPQRPLLRVVFYLNHTDSFSHAGSIFWTSLPLKMWNLLSHMTGVSIFTEWVIIFSNYYSVIVWYFHNQMYSHEVQADDWK